MRGRRTIGVKRRIIQAYAGLCAATALAILLLAAPAPAHAEEFPVWWSPSLGLESLDDIDAMLDAP